MESGGAQAAASSTALRSRISWGDDNSIEEKRRGMESGSAQAVASSKAPQSRVTFGDENSIEEKRRKIESGSAQAVASAAPQSRVPLGDDGRPLDGVMRAKLLRNLKHGDGSIFRSNGYWAKVYRLHDTNETCLEPMMMTEPLTSCMPDWMVCQRHEFRTMMQIFLLKLAYTSSYVAGPVQLYGYVAVRDLLNPMRNYIFNRTRDDPFVVEHDGFIRMTGPKRGIRMEAPVLIEFDMKIKREVEDDLQLIDCVASFNDIISRHAMANRRRIDGDCGGAVDITYALVHSAAEATVQVGISELAQGDGFRLDAAAFYTGSSLDLNERIQLFDGIVSAEASELSRTVVAVVKVDQLLVSLILSQASGSDHRFLRRSCTFPVQKHGNRISVFKLGLATIEMKVTWSTLDIPQSLFGPNCFEWEFMAAEVEYEGD